MQSPDSDSKKTKLTLKKLKKKKKTKGRLSVTKFDLIKRQESEFAVNISSEREIRRIPGLEDFSYKSPQVTLY